jgi:hypothetical protein
MIFHVALYIPDPDKRNKASSVTPVYNKKYNKTAISITFIVQSQ